MTRKHLEGYRKLFKKYGQKDGRRWSARLFKRLIESHLEALDDLEAMAFEARGLLEHLRIDELDDSEPARRLWKLVDDWESGPYEGPELRDE